MSKAKKKKENKKPISIINEVDKTLNMTYDAIMSEIEELQLELYLAEEKARKKARKKIKKDPYYFDNSLERIEARKEVIQRIEGTNLLDRIENVFKDICPIVIIIARLIASLILAILSFEPIKTHIKPETLSKLQKIYQSSLNIK